MWSRLEEIFGRVDFLDKFRYYVVALDQTEVSFISLTAS